jgi:hypothetical protein
MLPLTKIPGPNYYCFVLNFVLDMLFFEIWMIAVYLCMFVGFIFGHFLFVYLCTCIWIVAESVFGEVVNC